VVDGPAVTDWALPMAALGLALIGSAPFADVAVQPLHGLSGLDASGPIDVESLLDDGVAVARLALARASITGGRVGAERARRPVAVLADPPQGSADVDGLAEAVDAAFAAGCPAAALPALDAALEQGVAEDDAARVRALAAPLLAS